MRSSLIAIDVEATLMCHAVCTDQVTVREVAVVRVDLLIFENLENCGRAGSYKTSTPACESVDLNGMDGCRDNDRKVRNCVEIK